MLKLIAPALVALALAPASASVGYELRLIEKDGQRTIAVASGKEKIAVARGAKELDVLDAAAAKTAWAQTDAELNADKGRIEWTEGDQLMVQKSKPGDKSENGKEKSVEKRIIVRKGEDGETKVEIDGDHDAVIVEELEDGDMAFLDLDGAEGKRRVIRIEKETEEGAKEEKRRLIRIIGAKPESARRFIDEAEGLDASERAAMKAAVGL